MTDRVDILKKRNKKQKNLFLEAYKNKACNVSQACAAINISRETYYEWRRSDKEFDKQCMEVEDSLLDLAEGALIKNILAGKETSIFFYLVNRGKGKWVNIQKVETKFDDTAQKKINEVFDMLKKILENEGKNKK